MPESEGQDKVVYFGVININENQKTIGAVDVWRSVITKELFCEEKRLGILDIVEFIGMPRIEEGKKWAVAVSRIIKGRNRWKLIKLISQGEFEFSDLEDKVVTVEVRDYKIIDREWWSFLVERNVNRNLEVTEEAGIK
ncbi:MAG: hypothetical protein QN720_11170 [Nitrososphaeraceae archaeon]|jgi:hypothetical protein|nr:hypothetical protein [Nitrososphaeraceae archaeon]MDW0283055.1 hypothetical protein [Nitrososphaeraceae archaeon]MDW0333500.1 hypothetical protein [Nitrososphaeraceae archaeon]